MTNLFGHGQEPFWQQASTNLVKFVILLHQTLDDYVTLYQVYEHVINPDKLRAKILDGDRRFAAQHRRLVVSKDLYLETDVLKPWTWEVDASGREMWSHWSADLEDALKTGNLVYRAEDRAPAPDDTDRVARFESVKRWFQDDWMRIEPKLRTSIVEGISVFLSLFDDNPKVKHTFCPPKATYDAAESVPGEHGTPLLPLSELIEQGKIIALNFPIAMNPGLARALGGDASEEKPILDSRLPDGSRVARDRPGASSRARGGIAHGPRTDPNSPIRFRQGPVRHRGAVPDQGGRQCTDYPRRQWRRLGCGLSASSTR
jgi:hypothetical protein